MHIFLFIFYSAVLCYIIPKIPLVRNSGIRPVYLLLLFACRVITGCLHNWVAYKYYPNHGDVWLFFRESFTTRHELLTNFHAFLADNSTWAYMPHNTIECMHVLLNFFSRDDLYISTLLFAFPAFLGAVALFRAFRGLFDDDLICAFCALLLPSTLFWTSCILTEGLAYTFLGFFFYFAYRLFLPQKPTSALPEEPIPSFPEKSTPVLKSGESKYWLFFLCLLFFLLIAFFRPAIALALVCGIYFWLLAKSRLSRFFQSKSSNNRLFGWTLGIISGIILLVAANAVLGGGVLRTFSERQKEFQGLSGNSRIYLPILEADWRSFLDVLPFAFVNGLFQPTPGSGGQAIYLVFSGELILIWMAVGFALLVRMIRPPAPSRKSGPSGVPHSGLLTAFGICSIVMAFSGMLMIGYIIPFVGAIIRYRSVYLPFLVIPLLHTLRSFWFMQNWNDWLNRNILTDP
jgi:hypothetical protein